MAEPAPVPAPVAAHSLVAVHQLVERGIGDHPAVTVRSETVTYAELAERVARVAGGLGELGIGRGDRVVIWAEKRIETVVAILAASSVGAIFVPVNPLFRARHLAHVVNDCSARALVTTVERLVTAREALTDLRCVGQVILLGESGSMPLPHAGWQVTAWDHVSEHAAVAARTVIDSDVAAIFYTSGSTGGPKGVVLSHRNLLVGALSVAGYLEHTPADVVLGVLPLSFDAGFSQLTSSLVAGAHVVLTNYLTAREVVRLCARHQVTGLTCVPPLWLQLAAVDWPMRASASLRYFANTGGRMPRATLTRLRTLLPQARPYLMYGLTEAFRSTYLDPAEADRRPDSIGKAIPNAEILVLRPDGTRCDPGEHGELVHRGPLVALGYWGDHARTAERFRPLPGPSGLTRPEIAVWSGDRAYHDDEGFLFFVGRTDDMIKTSGYRVSPTEIEEVAYASGLVEEAVALGVPDDRLGQQIALVVAPPCDAVVLRKTLAQELPAYMQPAEIMVLDRLPRSVNGKFDRVELRRTVVGR